MKTRGSISVWLVAGPIMTASLVGALVGCSNEGGTPLPRSFAQHVHWIPQASLAQGTTMYSADFAIGKNGVLHVVSFLSSGRERGVFYVRGTRSPDGWSWAPPRRLPIESPSAPRIVAEGDRLRVLAGSSLQHLSSDDGGVTWRDRGKLIESPGANAYDVVFFSDTLLVAYTGWSRSGWSADHSATLLRTIRSAPDQTVTNVLIAFPGSGTASPGPRLVRRGGQIDLLWQVARGLPGQTFGPLPVDAWDAQILEIVGGEIPGRHLDVPVTAWKDSSLRQGSARSEDGGRTWSHLGSGIGGNVHPDPSGVAYGALAAAAGSQWLRAAWIDQRMWTSWRRVDAPWSTSTMLDSMPSKQHETELGQVMTQVVPTQRGDVVVWISARHGELVPAELPFSDRFLFNNDVYVAVFDPMGEAASRIHRINRYRSQTVTIRAGADGDTLYVLRAGYETAKDDMWRYDPDSTLSLTTIPLRELFER